MLPGCRCGPTSPIRPNGPEDDRVRSTWLALSDPSVIGGELQAICLQGFRSPDARN